MPTEELTPDTPVSAATHSLPLLLLWLAVRRKKLLWSTALAIFLLALSVALLLPPQYTATVVIMPPQQGGPSGASMMAQLGNLGALASLSGSSGLGIKNPNDQQVALLKSASVEDAMIARFHLQAIYHRKYLSTTRKRWERSTVIDNGLKDGLIHLSVTDTDPRRAAAMANGWVEEYRRFLATLAVTEASQRRRFFEVQLNLARASLATAEEEMKQTQQRTGVMEIEGQSRALIASAAVLRAQVAAKQVEIQAMHEFAADQNPDLVRAEQELTGLEGQLAEMDVNSDRQAGDLITPKGKVAEDALEYTRALREVKYREMVEELLTRQYEGARVDEARQGSQVEIIDPAIVPDRPREARKIWIVLGALLIDLPLALLIAAALEVIDILRRYRFRFGSWMAAIEAAFAGAGL